MNRLLAKTAVAVDQGRDYALDLMTNPEDHLGPSIVAYFVGGIVTTAVVAGAYVVGKYGYDRLFD